jgi:flagellar biosynthetic protein FliP
MKQTRAIRAVTVILLIIAFVFLPGTHAHAAAPPGLGTVIPGLEVNIGGQSSDAVNIILLLTVLSVLPSILLMMTCFTRIVIVFSLLRNALGLQQTPPNQVIIGLALFLSLFIMQPTLNEINTVAYQPFSAGQIDGFEFIDRASVPLRGFMIRQTYVNDLNMFQNLSGNQPPETIDEYPMTVIIPAFITSELKRAFVIGFFLFLPFMIIDIVVASALMSMGMMMMPPITISLPFKILLFVLVDGWTLLIQALVQTYNF